MDTIEKKSVHEHGDTDGAHCDHHHENREHHCHHRHHHHHSGIKAVIGNGRVMKLWIGLSLVGACATIFYILTKCSNMMYGVSV